MRKIALFFIPFFLLSAWPANAQLKKIGKGIRSAVQNSTNAEKAPLSSLSKDISSSAVRVTSVQTEKNLSSTVVNSLTTQVKSAAQKQTTKSALANEIRRSVFLAESPSAYQTQSTGFVFATEWNGKKEYWGTLAQHRVDGTEKDLTVSFFKDGEKFQFKGRIVVEGNVERLDAALIKFEPTEEFLNVVIPLKLAKQVPSPGENVDAYGYTIRSSDAPFYPALGSEVLVTGPSRIATTYVYEPRTHSGSCGGPLLNTNHEVVGVHCGASTEQSDITPPPQFLPKEGQNIWPIESAQRRVSQAVPARLLEELVRTYHDSSYTGMPVRWNGIQVASLRPSERITLLRVLDQNYVKRVYRAQDHEPFLDESHLEAVVNSSGATEIRFEIEDAAARPPAPMGKRIFIRLEDLAVRTEFIY